MLELYNKEIKKREEMELIAESILVDPIVNPEDEVDTDAVPQSAIDKANAALDQIVDADDYDDTDLQDLMDDEDDEDSDLGVIIAEAIGG